MATSTNTIKNTYPLPVYNYRVEIGDKTIAFSEVSGLSYSLETVTYKESRTTEGVGPVTMHMPAQATPVNLTLKKGYVKSNSIKVLYDWINSTAINQIEKKDISVSLLDETGAPVVVWTVVDAFPTKLDAPTFDANANEVAVESMELMASSVRMAEA